MKPKSPGKPQQRTKSAYEPRSLFRNINASTLQRTETILILIDVGAQAFVVVLMPKSYFVPVPDDTTPTEERFFADMDAAVYARYVSSGAMLVYLLALMPRLRGLRSVALRSRSDRADIFVLLLLLVGLAARWCPQHMVATDIKLYELEISLGYLCLLALHFILRPSAGTLSKRLRKIHANRNDDHIQISIESSDASYERKPSTAPTAFTAPASQHANTLFGNVQLYAAEDIPEAAKVIVQRDERSAPKLPKHFDREEIYEQVLITGELRAELWNIETMKLNRKLRVLNKKAKIVSNELDKLNTQRVELETDCGKLIEEEKHYSGMIEQLKLQESFEIPNPELIKANALAKHCTELEKDISMLDRGNERLLTEKAMLQATLDELESGLCRFDEDEEDDMINDDKIFFGIDPNASPAEQLAVIRKKVRLMDNELMKEQRKTVRVEKEMEQLNSHLTRLSGSSSSSWWRVSDTRDRGNTILHTEMSDDYLTDIALLELRILDLKKKKRAYVLTITEASQCGDKESARNADKKRRAVKEELAQAQDALHTLKVAAADDRGEPAPRSSLEEAAPGKEPFKVGCLLKSQASQQQEDKMPTLTGFLDKGPTEWSGKGLVSRVKTMRGARERWCEICPDGRLRYYKRRGDTEVRGEIDLNDASFEVTCHDLKRGNEFVLCTSDQQSHFFTKSSEELQIWVRTLRAANSYLRTNKHLDAIAGKLDAAERRHGGRGAPEDDEQFYGRATLGF